MPYENPVLVEWLRGGALEAQNRGAYCLYLAETVVAEAGEVDRPYFLRSGAKYFQAAAGLATGLTTRFGLDDRELALMCASHNGEPEHVAVAQGMLERGGLGVHHLQCGPHLPLHPPSAADLVRRGESPSPLHNNCSGKHAGMLLAALAGGGSLEDYLDPGHPHQQAIRQVVCDFAEAGNGEVATHIDGCSAPTFVMSLRAAARAFRNFGNGQRHLPPALRDAARQLRQAVAAWPRLLAGKGRFCSAIIAATHGRILVKVGADGFYGAVVPEAGAGLAVHVDDGSTAASERLVAALLHRFGLLADDEFARLARFVDPVRRNHAGREVGTVTVHLPGG